MNIWILNHHATGDGRHPSLAKYLSDTNKVTLYSSSFIHNTFIEEKRYLKDEYYKEEKVDDYNRVYIKTPKYYGNGVRRLINQIFFSMRSYKTGLKKIKEESTPSIIIGSSVHLFTGITAYLLAKKSNAKFVFEIRDIWPQTLIDLGALKENSIPAKVFSAIEVFLYKRADLIVSVLPEGYRHVESLSINKDKVYHLPNGIDVKKYEEDLKNTKPSQVTIDYFTDNADKYIFTYTGAHGIANGLDTIIETANKMKDNREVEFLLVGEGPEKKELKKKKEQLGLTNVTFMDKVPKGEASYILENSDACIFHLNKTPVFNYGISSNKLFDYLISGKPMIFAVETSTDFIGKASNGINVPPENPSEMKDAVLKIVKMKQSDKDSLGKNGQIYVRKHHDYKELANKLTEKLGSL